MAAPTQGYIRILPSERCVLCDSHTLESALWMALRVLEERINLQKRLAEQAKAGGRKSGRQLFEARAAENLKHARVLRQLLEKIGD